VKNNKEDPLIEIVVKELQKISPSSYDPQVWLAANSIVSAIRPAIYAEVWRAKHTLNGKCRYCLTGLTSPGPEHEMRCKFYIGELRHQ